MSKTIEDSEQFVEVFQNNDSFMYINFIYDIDDLELKEQNDYFEEIAAKYYNNPNACDQKFDFFKVNLTGEIYQHSQDVRDIFFKNYGTQDIYGDPFIGFYIKDNLYGLVKTHKKDQVKDLFEEIENKY
ncbi:hypothetical protein BN7_2447 [Wickerhamomyces ciferrii]|uniref:Uncharacterized protein n=1 Tax=Wickerhamomyces ciferrii (strain ATCC 14091 / BCRC 22168 / CBS 111 / JCM 3599 / NBRC 0793 / NRRL Y-1031 F-60-10) TaxID=1206466 RepID=K0KIT7_WICCF|nr:uncharacterized protein BN7_2447 [Wickerhamomyces ciferrii]CCH42901.1 hypothetical protein BN7_2447 [Wickerhamomyces ciferrii]